MDCSNGHGPMQLYLQAPDDDTDDFYECASCGEKVYVAGQQSAEPYVEEDE